MAEVKMGMDMVARIRRINRTTISSISEKPRRRSQFGI
jgi:hypothetical protein